MLPIGAAVQAVGVGVAAGSLAVDGVVVAADSGAASPPPPQALISKVMVAAKMDRRALLVTCEHVFIQVLSWFIVLQTADCLHFHLPPIHSNE